MTEKSDATEMNAQGLLQAAARLIEKALIKLDTKSVDCPHCETQLFRNRDHGRVYERLSDTPTKLRNCAEVLDQSMVNGKPRQSSHGYDKAQAATPQHATATK